MTELDQELSELSEQLGRHEAATPPPRSDDVGLLEHLPHAEIDLNALAADRLRRFLEAFRIEIHHDHRTRRVTLRAEISGNTIDQLVQQV